MYHLRRIHKRDTRACSSKPIDRTKRFAGLMFFASIGFHRLKHPPIHGNFAALLARTSSRQEIMHAVTNRVIANPLSLFVQLWRLLRTFLSLWLLVAHSPRLSWTCVLIFLFCVVDSAILDTLFFSIPLAQTLAYSLIKVSE